MTLLSSHLHSLEVNDRLNLYLVYIFLLHPTYKFSSGPSLQGLIDDIDGNDRMTVGGWSLPSSLCPLKATADVS